MAKPKQYDWEAIFTDIRTGVLSKREVARKYSVDPSYMLRKAKKAGVKQDLSARVKQAVHTKLVHTDVHTQTISDDEIVEAAAEVGFQVSNLHRIDIARYRALSNKLLEELDGQTDGVKVLEQAKAALKENDMDGLVSAVQKITALPERIKGAALLAGTLKNLITLERQAFNLDEDGHTGNLAGATILLEPHYITGDNAKRD